LSTRVLLTGGLGFIASHAVEHWLKNTDWEIVVIDSLRHAGRIERLTDIEEYDPDRVTVHWHDLNVQFTPLTLSRMGDFDYIVNMAADSHVDRSIVNPGPFIRNNVNLATTMLDYARFAEPEKFIQIGTDEIFGPAPAGVSHKEDDPLRPSNPYSASKAAQEQIAFAYWRTYDVPVILTRTMNNVGERQDTEKYVPMVMKKVLNGETVEVHGKPHPAEMKSLEDEGYTDITHWEIGSRVWLHARNHADALMWILQNDEPSMYMDGDYSDHPNWWNIAGDEELSNLEIAQEIAGYIGKPLKYEMVDFHSSRPGHDLRYSLDGSRLRNAGWAPPMDIHESLKQIVEWTMNNLEWLDG